MNGCTINDCNRRHRARGLCDTHYNQFRCSDQFTYAAPGPLICDCPTPAPTPTDMCATCYRVIANLVHARRARQANR